MQDSTANCKAIDATTQPATVACVFASAKQTAPETPSSFLLLPSPPTLRRAREEDARNQLTVLQIYHLNLKYKFVVLQNNYYLINNKI